MTIKSPLRRARIIEEWFDIHGIPRLDWAPYSPDLNPIKNIWAILKQRILERWPHLLDQGSGQEALDALVRAIVIEWNDLEQEIIDATMRSLDSRINAVQNAEGWYARH